MNLLYLSLPFVAFILLIMFSKEYDSADKLFFGLLALSMYSILALPFIL